MKTLRSLAGAAIAAALLATPALAVDTSSVTFAQFTQQTSTKVAQYNAVAGGNTLTIVDSLAYFVVNAFGPIGFYPTTMSLSAASGALVTSVGPQFQQLGWSGSINFGNALNYLTVNFTNATFSFDGAGGSASLISTDPSNPISYSSNLLSLPAFDLKNFSLAFTGITPSFTVAANGFGTPFNANIAGSFAGADSEGGTGGVPEPSSWALLVAGFGLVGFAARRRAGLVTVAS